MLDLEDLRLVRAIGASRSLASAARLLDLTPPAVTLRLQRMEARLEVRLAVRQSKGIALTDEGQRLYQEAVAILERVEALPLSLSGDHGDVQGTLRVVAPFGFGASTSRASCATCSVRIRSSRSRCICRRAR